VISGLFAVALAADSTPLAIPVPPALVEAERRYGALASSGGWPALPNGPPLEPGTLHDQVALLRRRLGREGYRVAAGTSPAEHYDDLLAQAVRRFQELHGLSPDGVVGPATRRQLNMSASARWSQLRAAVARSGDQPPAAAGRELVVNIPAFTLEVVDSGRVLFSLRVIVGRPSWPTPVVQTTARELVFAPAWRIPSSIATTEMLPAIRRDPEYLARHQIRVEDGTGRTIAPATIDWARVTPHTFRYTLVQRPGPLNPLGRVKLVLRSRYGVHLHDTPARSHFSRPARALSHGCIRVEHPARLVAFLLPEWSPDSVDRAMSGQVDLTIGLDRPIAVRLVYRTVWVEGDGLVAFRPDIYRRDRTP
jgi:murein L,D-transpeptidase YcbB/YkuD